MTVSPSASLLQHEAFAELSDAGRQKLEQATQLLRFRIGQALCDGQLIPHQVLLIREGTARLLGEEGHTLITLGRMGPGAVVGLASLLRVQGCELVTAASDLEAWSLPDALVLDELCDDSEGRLAH